MFFVLKIFKYFIFLFIVNAHSYQASIPRENGDLIHYYLKTPEKKSFPILLWIQGSQCLSAHRHLERYEELSKGAPAFGILVVEKYGLNKEHDETKKCPESYLRNNDLNQRVKDYRKVLSHLEDQKNNWNKELFILGGSEGADITARLAPILNPKKIVVLVGGLGMTMAESLSFSIRRLLEVENYHEQIIENELSNLPSVFQEIAQNPTWKKTWGGPTNTYQYWNSLLFHRTWIDLLKFKGKILSIHGTNDSSVPVESARKLVDIFDENNKENLEYWEYAGLGHDMKDEEGNEFTPKILKRALDWLWETH